MECRSGLVSNCNRTLYRVRTFHLLDFFLACFYNGCMRFIELTIHTTSEASELISDVMWDYSSFGVTVCDYNDILSLQKDSTVFWDYMDDSVAEPKTEVLVKCFLEPQEAEAQISAIMRDIYERKSLSEGCIDFGSLEETKREIEGDDWIDVWKKHFRPLHIGKRIVVVPEWICYEKQPNEEIVLLDSNMAFGTGEHETTSMCLELLQEYLKEGDVVLDVGCGSGILGISAAKLGAKCSYLSDLDPIAVKSANHNASKNGVTERTIVTEANLLDGSSLKADLILANITAEVLALLAPAIPNTLKEDGTLILSGIIKDRLHFVKATYAEVGLKVIDERTKGEWHALVLKANK